ncbi:MAG: flagellar motor switch protein FliN [Spirochaetaceae bacterium]|jgi:flagellar motor switch protein FliN/FliY|nr:flagellar motor switch protein FliN [Spirochaetaceae bacterium]
MSDGALSQAEIDALLSGTAAAPATGDEVFAAVDPAAMGAFLSGNVGALSANLSTMTGGNVVFSGPIVSSTNRDGLLGKLPDSVTVIKADFTAGFPGEHIFIVGENTAKGIASLMNKEANIELDDMAMSVLGEVVSQIVGSQITALTQKTGNKSIVSGSPQAANVPKATAALPSGNFVTAEYGLDLGDGIHQQLWEIYGADAAADISAALKTVSSAPKPAASSSPAGGMNAMGGAFGNSMGGMIPPGVNVQPVQYPNLASQIGPREQGNIGLLMDVMMEMTVELGRTRKPIKEILAMGEGTIIELDKLAGEPVDILVNNKLIAKGEVVVIDENFGVRVTEIVSPLERMSEIG